MEIIIAISEGETLQQALRQVSMDVAGPFTLTIKTEEAKTTVSSDLKQTAMKPAGKKRGRPKGSKNKKRRGRPKKVVTQPELPKLDDKPMRAQGRPKGWTKTESIWMANRPKPSGERTAKIGKTKVTQVEAAFAHEFGYRRTFKSLYAKWKRMNN
jgi:hypothetical protein